MKRQDIKTKNFFDCGDNWWFGRSPCHLSARCRDVAEILQLITLCTEIWRAKCGTADESRTSCPDTFCEIRDEITHSFVRRSRLCKYCNLEWQWNGIMLIGRQTDSQAFFRREFAVFFFFLETLLVIKFYLWSPTTGSICCKMKRT